MGGCQKKKKDSPINRRRRGFYLKDPVVVTEERIQTYISEVLVKVNCGIGPDFAVSHLALC